MDKGTDIPLGFGFALAQDPAAMREFSSYPSALQDEILRKARSVTSKDEMQSLVRGLTEQK